MIFDNKIYALSFLLFIIFQTARTMENKEGDFSQEEETLKSISLVRHPYRSIEERSCRADYEKLREPKPRPTFRDYCSADQNTPLIDGLIYGFVFFLLSRGAAEVKTNNIAKKAGIYIFTVLALTCFIAGLIRTAWAYKYGPPIKVTRQPVWVPREMTPEERVELDKKRRESANYLKKCQTIFKVGNFARLETEVSEDVYAVMCRAIESVVGSSMLLLSEGDDRVQDSAQDTYEISYTISSIKEFLLKCNEFYCDGNSIPDFELRLDIPDDIVALMNLKKLTINAAFSITHKVCELPFLEHLEVTYSPDGTNPIALSAISCCKKLKTLILSHNNLTDQCIWWLSIDRACSIENIDLSHNNLMKIPERMFSEDSNERKLSSTLKKLIVSYNQVKDVPASIGKLEGLTELNISHNEIRDTVENGNQLTCLRTTARLKKLNFSYNPIAKNQPGVNMRQRPKQRIKAQ